MYTHNFSIALDHWQTSGGAMNYLAGDARSEPAWEVVDADDLEERIEGSAKDATIYALEMGGLTIEQIAEEMASWID